MNFFAKEKGPQTYGSQEESHGSQGGREEDREK